MNLLSKLAILLALSLTVACAGTGVTYEPSAFNVREIEQGLRNDLAVGEFTRSESEKVQDPWKFRQLTTIKSPIGEGHHDFIANAISMELMLARKLDKDSGMVLQGNLVEQKMDTGLGTGKGSIEMRFNLNTENGPVFEESKRIDHQWESSFVGMTAANQAMRGYLEMIEKLVNKLFTDADFIEAVNRGE
jgi:hypothetical protein